MKNFSQIQPYLYTQSSKNSKYTLTFNKKGDVSVGFSLGLKEVNTLSKEELENIHDTFTKAVINLPEGTCIHKQDFFFTQSHKGTNLERDNFLFREQEKYFYERGFLDHESYIYLSFSASTYLSRTSKNTIFSGGKGNPIKFEKLDVFFNAVEKFEYQLSKSGIIIKPLNSAESTKVKYRYFTLSKNGNCVSDFSFEDSLRVGDRSVKIYSINSVKDFPTNTNPHNRIREHSTEKSTIYGSFLYPITFKLDFDHIINTVIHRVDESKLKAKAKTEQKKVRGIANLSHHNSKIFLSNDRFIERCESDFFNACNMHFNLVSIAESDHEKKVKNESEHAFEEISQKPCNNKIRLANIFWGCAPFNATDLPIEVMSPSFIQIATCFNNWETNYKSGIDGMVLYDRFTQRPIVVDLWNKPYDEKIIGNRNAFMIGFSGEGKSVDLNDTFRQYIEQEFALIVMDIGNSFKKLCELYGGKYFVYDRNKPLFNPFITDNPDDEFIESLSDLIFTSWKRKMEDVTREEESLVKLSLRNYYKHLEINPELIQCFDTYYNFYESHCAQKDREYGDNIFNVESFLLVMKDFCTGEYYGNVFNGSENITLSDNFIVFELENIKDHKILFPIVSHVISHTVNNTIFKKEGIKKAIWIDEAWKVLEHPGMAQFLKYLYKTIRKKQGQVGIAVQDITDVPDNAIGKTILDNSAIKIFLPHIKNINSIPELATRCSLTKHTQDLLYSVKSNIKEGNFTEKLIVLGNYAKVYRLELSPYSYYTYTSEETENIEIFKYFNEEGSMQKAITRMVEENSK